MCNLFNTFFGGCASQASTIGSCGRCGQCGSSGWTCGYQRVCRDGHGNIVIVGNTCCQGASETSDNDDSGCYTATQSSASTASCCGCARRCAQRSCFYNCNN